MSRDSQGKDMKMCIELHSRLWKCEKPSGDPFPQAKELPRVDMNTNLGVAIETLFAPHVLCTRTVRITRVHLT